MSTPIFDQLAGELGDPELPAWDRVKRVQGYTLGDLYALQAAVKRYQTRQRLPVNTDRPYYVNHEKQSLQKVTIAPPSDMVERCPPSKETCMTLDEIPGGQEHGVIIPPEPERTHRTRLVELIKRTPGWHFGPGGSTNKLEFQHDDGRGIIVWLRIDDSFDRSSYFDLGQPTTIVPGYDNDFDSLTTAISARAYWPEHVRRVEREDELDLASIKRAQESGDFIPAEQVFTEMDVEANRQLHEASDGKYLNPGATIAKHRAVADTEDERAKAPVYGADMTRSGGAIFAQFPDGSVRMVQDRSTSEPAVGADAKQFPTRFELPPDVVEKVQAKVADIKKMAEALSGAGMRTMAPEEQEGVKEELQPTSILPQGHEFEILREAADTIGGGRQDDYGNAEDSFTAIAKMWQAYLAARGARGPLDGRDVACMMSLLKVARDAKGRKRDNLVDIAGYAALGERATRSDR